MSRFDRQNLKKPPRRGLRVSEHALIRFRERVEEEFLHRSNEDLTDLLNERIHAAVFSREVVDTRELGTPTTLYLFEGRTGVRFVAVVREKCVVTVLDDWMARNNYPGWEDGTITPPQKFSLTAPLLAEKVRALAFASAELVQTPLAASSVAVVASPPAPLSMQGPSATLPMQVPSESSTEQPDMYSTLAAECRALGQRLRSLREQHSVLEGAIEAVLKDYEEKRGRLLAIMDEGAPS